MSRYSHLSACLGTLKLSILFDLFQFTRLTYWADLQRLVLGAYEATKNTLQETTQFSKQYSDIPNLMLGDNNVLLPGADQFVIYTGDAAALSLAMVVAVPIIAALLMGVNFLLTTNTFPCWPLPWGYVNALKAAVIYSALDSKDVKTGLWDRSTTAPIYKGDHSDENGAVAHVRPGLYPDRRTLSWLDSGHDTPA